MQHFSEASDFLHVGRKEECRTLEESLLSGQPEFIAVYGRRRVGKTHLVRHAFGNRFTFQHAGLSKSGMPEQLAEFSRSLKRSFGRNFTVPENWFDAFDALRDAVSSRRGRKILFFDEMPWMDTPKSGFLPALEHFWNGWASGRSDIILVVCGSAASWIVDKLIDDYGGLHDRLTHRIHLRPFTLGECREFASKKGLAFGDAQILEGYMAFGGVPYYWNLFRRGESIAQGIDRLCFREGGELRGEFDRLYSSLFRNPERCVEIVKALSKKKSGLTKPEIVKSLGFPDNGRLTAALKALENCGFIRRFRFPGKKERDAVWQLVDLFSLFHFGFLADSAKVVGGNWIAGTESPSRNAWNGLAFERVCLLHVEQIKKALGISGVSVSIYACSIPAGENGEPGAQIDLVLDRADGIVDLCEMKHTREPFAVSAEYRAKLLDKVSAYRRKFNTGKAIHVVLVASGGMRQNANSDAVQSVVVLEDLFG